MPAELFHKVQKINVLLAELLPAARRALIGQGDFGVEQIRALSTPIAEMAPVMARAAELRVQHPEIAAELDRYKSQLRDLQLTIEKVHVVLLARRATMQSSRAHLQSVSQWADALKLTRP